MRVCFFSQEDLVKPQGGIGTYVRQGSIALAGRGHEVHAIVRQRDGAPKQEQVEGVTVHRVVAPGPPVLYSPLYFQAARRKFASLQREQPFDLVQGNLPLMSSWAVRGMSLPPVIETIHCTVRSELEALSHTPLARLNLNEVLTRLLAPVILRRERYLLRRAHRVIAVSAALKRELVEHERYPAERVEVIPNGIDYSRFASARQSDLSAIRHSLGLGEQRVILYLGRLVERKRVADLVRALPALLRRLPDTCLVVVGRYTANAQRVEQLAQALGVREQVRFVDHVPYADVARYYAMADVYALPSAYEGFPFTILEAMAAGTPVVASNIPGIDEQVLPGQTGLLHPVGDIDALSEQLLRMLQERDLAHQIADAAQRMVRDHYDWSVIGARTEQLFANALGTAAQLGRSSHARL